MLFLFPFLALKLHVFKNVIREVRLNVPGISRTNKFDPYAYARHFKKEFSLNAINAGVEKYCMPTILVKLSANQTRH